MTAAAALAVVLAVAVLVSVGRPAAGGPSAARVCSTATCAAGPSTSPRLSVSAPALLTAPGALESPVGRAPALEVEVLDRHGRSPGALAHPRRQAAARLACVGLRRVALTGATGSPTSGSAGNRSASTPRRCLMGTAAPRPAAPSSSPPAPPTIEQTLHRLRPAAAAPRACSLPGWAPPRRRALTRRGSGPARRVSSAAA